jgi:hypothetical protein
MNNDSVSIKVAERSPIDGLCELCTTDQVPLESTVQVRHTRGGTLLFAACDRCTRAMRRLAAAVGSEGRLTSVRRIKADGSVPESSRRPAGLADVLSAEVLAEIDEHIIGPDGTHYLIEICGGQRPDGMWSGWLQFEAVGARETRRTGQETTQGSRDDLLYWASGLGPAYFEGAFARSR